MDSIVEATRPLVLGLEFGWMKLNPTSRFYPAFKYTDKDSNGVSFALPILNDGYTADKKCTYTEFKTNIPSKQKHAKELKMLKLFNSKYNFSFE